MPDVLILTDELFIGTGDHQATYINPIDRAKCIKIPHTPDDGDVKKEMRYRRICKDKLENSVLITKYYGLVETNKGWGHVFERVINVDGSPGKHLNDFLTKGTPSLSEMEVITKLMMNFKKDFLREKIVIVDNDITNFMVQQISQNEYRIRIIDNIGTPAFIPFVYYFEFIATLKCQRYWNYLVGWLQSHYPKIFNEELTKNLKA
ncbi:MAG: hypothetical protein IJ862_02650 [Selenomonadaceae bacterium]|nr:hypothetical protein [Selenomonadaceae bacterium]